MSEQFDRKDYDGKSAGYFQCVRPEMLRFVPAHSRRILDVGCAEGAFGESLKRNRLIEVWGVEPAKPAATAAMTRLDRVIEGAFGPENALPERRFDCIFFNDVLEHMLAPERALSYAKTLLAPRGVVVASIPNVRFFPTVRDLMFHARWEYADSGILDRTHLRFFTRSSIVNMFEREGFEIDTICGINSLPGPKGARKLAWWGLRLLDRLMRNRFDDMRFMQFAVVARPNEVIEVDGGRNK